MRRTLRLALALTLLAVLGTAPAWGQPIPVAPGGTMVYSNASETCVNTTAECQVFQYTVPAAYIATFSHPSALVSPWYHGDTSTGLDTPVLWTTPQPLHLSMAGLLAGNSGHVYQIGVNFGGTQASVGINNALTSLTGAVPATLDVWLVPIASSSATPNAVNNFSMTARLVVGAGTGTGGLATITQVNTITAVATGSATQLNVLNRWSAASNAATIIWHKRLLKVGD